jgi:hypothetical protein
MKTLIVKSLLILPLPKGGNIPLFGKRGVGRFSNNDALLIHTLVNPIIQHEQAYAQQKLPKQYRSETFDIQ